MVIDRLHGTLAALMYTAILQPGAVCAGESETYAAPSVGALPAADTAWESSSEAWWTGPLIAAPAITLPQGKLYVESYLYDSIPYAVFDSQGRMHSVSGQHDVGSTTGLKYGISDRVTVGLISDFGYDWVDHGKSSSGLGVGDPSVQVQYRLTPFQPDTWIPTVSVNLQESLPLGRYDELQRPADGFGSGAYVTTFSTYLQSLIQTPNGRFLRVRLDLSYAVADRVSVAGQSVYGTTIGFRGEARPGDSKSADLAFEYSATRNWVLAIDFWMQRDANTFLTGSYPRPGGGTVAVSTLSGPDRQLTVAPALEYNWNDRVGFILGVQVVAEGRNATATARPVAAFSYFL
jgi:hypothetical protein